jgi:hypothetical protein
MAMSRLAVGAWGVCYCPPLQVAFRRLGPAGYSIELNAMKGVGLTPRGYVHQLLSDHLLVV